MTATAQPQVCHIWARCQVSHPAPVIACVATAHDILSSATTAQNVSEDFFSFFFMMLSFFFTEHQRDLAHHVQTPAVECLGMY